MPHPAGETRSGWLTHLGAAKRASMSRYSLAMCALRGLVRTKLHGDFVCFNEADVEQLAARVGKRPAA